ncbi:MAG: hypothetical protein J5509_08675 [Lachnospiraceae bacterium]|nr:hypothetical protein [Lachnospiraceae bacterium]
MEGYALHTESVALWNKPTTRRTTCSLAALESVLAGLGSADDPEQICKSVRQAVDDHAGSAPQFDDVTMLCLVMT